MSAVVARAFAATRRMGLSSKDKVRRLAGNARVFAEDNRRGMFKGDAPSALGRATAWRARRVAANARVSIRRKAVHAKAWASVWVTSAGRSFVSSASAVKLLLGVTGLSSWQAVLASLIGAAVGKLASVVMSLVGIVVRRTAAFFFNKVRLHSAHNFTLQHL